ncbi:hypothetical protein LSH36_100g03018 [Paralvinella palmiformis]|uniref:Uncharacterized protein n=1 Tax=Paralvinella palmiformis TaxID=53620 RepID=A0AAD9JZU9_9ANNE|nr:hypothetical protein LSH36_100g03018 [Paralvinella palmiformis]
MINGSRRCPLLLGNRSTSLDVTKGANVVFDKEKESTNTTHIRQKRRRTRKPLAMYHQLGQPAEDKYITYVNCMDDIMKNYQPQGAVYCLKLHLQRSRDDLSGRLSSILAQNKSLRAQYTLVHLCCLFSHKQRPVTARRDIKLV